MNKAEVQKTSAVGGKVNLTRATASSATAARAAAHPVQPSVDPQVLKLPEIVSYCWYLEKYKKFQDYFE